MLPAAAGGSDMSQVSHIPKLDISTICESLQYSITVPVCMAATGLLALCVATFAELLVLYHLMLKLNKSHNILEKGKEVTTKLLYFVQMMGAKSCLALFE